MRRTFDIIHHGNSMTPIYDSFLDLGSLNLAQADIHTVASILKLYLRNLPEPLVQTELYPRFLNAIRQRKYYQLVKPGLFGRPEQCTGYLLKF